MKVFEKSITIGDQTLTLQFGKLATAATTSVFASYADTRVLVTVTAGKVRDDIDYFPLQVEYAEKLYAGGIIKGSRWVKREGRPTDEAILKGRLIDRSIRPLFPKNYKREVQIVMTLLSWDSTNIPEIVAAIATSAAVHVSSIPWKGPISTLKLGYVPGKENDGEYVINPDLEICKTTSMNLVASTSKNKVLMIETDGREVEEAIVEEGLKRIKAENSKIIDFIESIREEIGMQKEKVEESTTDNKLFSNIKLDYLEDLKAFVAEKSDKEFDDGSTLEKFVSKVAEKMGEEADKTAIGKAIDYLSKQMIRDNTLDKKVRVDGRAPDEIRELSADVSILPRTHGTGLFQRGDTQVLSIATLAGPGLEQLIEGPEGQIIKRYIHHYFFPPSSVGETGRIGSVSRREIGHGALAEKAIEPVLPSEKDFPYVIRIVSEVLTSNGSTSMASTCGSSLALMDAGVPIKAPVAGIAMGLMSRSDEEYVILTDIMGIEDFSGEMDFKVTGTATGITAIQLDVKNEGLTDKMISETLIAAKKARLKILDVMNAKISKPREEVSKYAPKVVTIQIPPDRIGELIGPGGKNIKALIAESQADINVDDFGSVTIAGVDKIKVDAVVGNIQSMMREIQVGEEFEGEVVKIMPFGAFVEILPGKDGLVHVSKMGSGFVKNPEDVVSQGQKIRVRVNQIDPQGRISLEMIMPRSNNNDSVKVQ